MCVQQGVLRVREREGSGGSECGAACMLVVVVEGIGIKWSRSGSWTVTYGVEL